MIKLSAINAIKSSMNTDIFIGMVEEVDFEKEEEKIMIRISDKIILNENMLGFLNDCQKGIKAGDKVIMISSSDGQMFYVLGNASFIEDEEQGEIV